MEFFLLVLDSSIPSDNQQMKWNPLDKNSQTHNQLVSRFPQNNTFQLDIRIFLLDLDNSTQLDTIVWFFSNHPRNHHYAL
jgi:hypothetical protein